MTSFISFTHTDIERPRLNLKSSLLVFPEDGVLSWFSLDSEGLTLDIYTGGTWWRSLYLSIQHLTDSLTDFLPTVEYDSRPSNVVR